MGRAHGSFTGVGALRIGWRAWAPDSGSAGSRVEAPGAPATGSVRFCAIAPGSESEAAALLDAYLERAKKGSPNEGALHVRCTALHR